MKRQYFTSMNEIRAAVLSGQKVFWSNEYYVVTNSQCYHDKDHEVSKRRREFSAYDVETNTMLVSEHITTYFGGRLHDEEVRSCFVLIQEVKL